MLTLERLSSKGDLDELFMRIGDTSIKILAVILNHMKVNPKKQVTEVNLTNLVDDRTDESDKVIIDAVVRKNFDVVFDCHLCDEQCTDEEDYQTHMLFAHEGQHNTRVSSAHHIVDQIPALTAECEEIVRRVHSRCLSKIVDGGPTH